MRRSERFVRVDGELRRQATGVASAASSHRRGHSTLSTQAVARRDSGACMIASPVVRSPAPMNSRVRCSLWAASAFLFVASVQASTLVEVLPLTDRIVMLHFDDGWVNYHTLGTAKETDQVEVVPLKTAALATGAFAIRAAHDDDYDPAVAPLRIGRKSKGTEYAHNHTNWTDGFGFRPTTPYAALEHWVYLELPAALESGRTYTITWDPGVLGTAVGSASFVFDEAVTRSEAVHVNIVGYAPAAPQKFGYLYHWAGDLGGIDLSAWEGKPFSIVRVADGYVAHQGTIAFRRSATNDETRQVNDTPEQNFLGASVWECDFSALTDPGEYRLVVPGIGCSFPFEIDRDIYRQAFHAVMHGIYQNRSGIPLEAPHADEARPAPHNPRPVAEGGTPGFQNRLKYTTTRFCDVVTDGGGAADKAAIEAGAMGNLTSTWGWYQDAGDWDGYVSHQDIPIGLLLLYQLHPEKFIDGEQNIPESGNGIPDIVDEGAWLPRYFQRLRAELLAKGWGTGGVGARVFGDYWGDDTPGNIGRGSWLDTDRDWYVTGEDPFSTFRYAATAAQLADIYDLLGVADPEGIDWLAEATACYTWALANTRAGDETKSPHGSLKDNRALAAAALYRATGTASYHAQLQADLADLAATSKTLTGARLSAVALYLSMPAVRATDAALVARLQGALRGTALHISTASADMRACRWGGDMFMPMLVGQGTTPLIKPAVLAQRILGSFDAAAAADVMRVCYTTADYFLGCNPLHSTWITGLGERNPIGLFHMDDFYAGPARRVGLIPYGPWRFPDAWIDQRMAYSIWWAWDTTYPSIDARGAFQPAGTAAAPGTWPGHEAWFDNRASPQTGEFTVHQNNLPAALAYGFLTADQSRPPVVTAGPEPVTVSEGHSAIFEVSASDAEPLSYQWRRDGQPIIGATAAQLTWPNVQPFHAGSYDVVVTGTRGRTVSAAAELTVTAATITSQLRPVNISTRAQCGLGANVLIPGFVIEGTGTRRVLIRAVGPRLADFGVTDALADPVLEVVRTSAPSGTVATSDDWFAQADAAQIAQVAAAVGAFALDGRAQGKSLDSTSAAVLLELGHGSYTPICSGKNSTTGVSLVEIYDAGGDDTARLVNLSTRGFVGTEQQVMIPGFVVTGPTARSFIVRAAGPALERLSVAGALANPEIRVVSASSGLTVARNDDWSATPNDPVALAGDFLQVGAFPFMPGSRDAALRLILPAGIYTVVCSGYANTTGIALVEVYEMP